MNNNKNSIDRLLKTQQMINAVSDRITNNLSASLPSLAATQSQYAFINSRAVLINSATVAINSLSSIALTAPIALSKEITASLSSIAQSQIPFAVANFATVLDSIAKSAELAAKTLSSALTSASYSYINSLPHQWNKIIADLPSDADKIYWDDNSTPLSESAVDKVCNIVEQTVPNENPDKKAVLDKIKSKISVSDLIGIIGTIISLLLAAYGYISADAEQKKIEQQNQAIIEEFHKTQSAIERKESDQKNILLAVQQLTETVQELEGSLQPEGLQGKQDETNVNQPDGDSYPKD